VLPLAVDESLFRPRRPDERAAARRRHGLPDGAPLLLAVGRLNVQKNLHSLLRLHAAVRRAVPDALLYFVGEEDDIGLHEFGVLNTGYAAWLRGQAVDLGTAAAVTFLGPRFGEDLAQLYAAADVLVSASVYHRENFGLAPAEAQACGVPVVCSAWNGFRDVVRHGETGYLMDAVLTRHGVRVGTAPGRRRGPCCSTTLAPWPTPPRTSRRCWPAPRRCSPSGASWAAPACSWWRSRTSPWRCGSPSATSPGRGP
jgi:glycogen synthase